MIQRDGDGLEIKAERSSKKELVESCVHTKSQNPQGMEVEWEEGFLEATAGLKGILELLE